ncbi:hypothetical protein CANARDRAFT_193008, partial [[Candida] arabinofermentans NRRL YB-2248]
MSSTKSGVYVVIQLSATTDDQSQFISKDLSEIIEIAWEMIDSTTLEDIHKDSMLVKPINTPVSPLCTSITGLTWDSVKNASSLKDAVNMLDESINKYIISNERPFSFITFKSWDLRMKLPKESREKSIQLPRYLEYPRHFDLKKEFVKLQESLYPESSNISSLSRISLNQMVTALDVDLKFLNSSTDATNPEINLSIPRRAAVTTQIMSGCLRALVKLSSTHKTILTKPHDMNLDLNQFFNEQSRILYMTNLPIDTTQSELESWFTQFGGRPIAFWTVKTPPISEAAIPISPNNNNSRNNNNTIDSAGKPTCSGFAIFATHEEAIDSLAMNGRALNEKTIEVQPSSVRVLDKAQEILTPFPSSKNRPRPGDWTCPSCGFSNFQRRTACFRCSFPAASAAAIQESIQQTQTHKQNQLNNNNNSSNVPFRAGDWKCVSENCTYHNFAKNICCLKCGAPRVQSAILNGHAHNAHHNHHHQQHH